MIVFTNSWKIWLAGLAVSLGIFAIIYFTVIKPNNDTANDVINQSLQQQDQALQQSQQALDQSQQQLDQANSTGGGGNAGSGSANEAIDQAQQLAQCIADAGTDAAAIQQCQAQFSP